MLGDLYMKKIIYILLITFILSTFISTKNENTLPQDAIRFRIIANSNNTQDQKTKLLIKQELEKNFFPLLENTHTSIEAKQIIENNKNVINKTIEKYNIPYTINYGKNYFPEKHFQGKIYKEGEYESLVISLGEASGKNWWCVMYPPLCLLEKQNTKKEKIEYRSYFLEMISKLTS